MQAEHLAIQSACTLAMATYTYFMGLLKIEKTERICLLLFLNPGEYMISAATEADKTQITNITIRAGVFNQEEIDSVPVMFDEYIKYGTEGDGYHFIVYREGDQILGYAIFGWRDLTDGVYDLYWIAVDPSARRKGVGRALLTASKETIRELGGRIIIIETSGTPEYTSTREFYVRTGCVNEAIIKDYYKPGDDLWIFTKKV